MRHDRRRCFFTDCKHEGSIERCSELAYDEKKPSAIRASRDFVFSTKHTLVPYGNTDAKVARNFWRFLQIQSTTGGFRSASHKSRSRASTAYNRIYVDQREALLKAG